MYNTKPMKCVGHDDDDLAVYREAPEGGPFGDVVGLLGKYEEALHSIDSIAIDYGYFEDAARAMQEIARKALYGK